MKIIWNIYDVPSEVLVVLLNK